MTKWIYLDTEVKDQGIYKSVITIGYIRYLDLELYSQHLWKFSSFYQKDLQVPSGYIYFTD